MTHIEENDNTEDISYADACWLAWGMGRARGRREQAEQES